MSKRFSLLSFFCLLFWVASVSSLRIANHAVATSRHTSLNMVFNLFAPKADAGSKVSIPANKKICVITGTSSGLGKETAKALLNKEDYFVICACRDVEKMKSIAKKEGFDEKSHLVMELDLASFDSVRKFASNLMKVKNRPLDRLVCNAAVYQPALSVVSFILLHLNMSLIYVLLKINSA